MRGIAALAVVSFHYRDLLGPFTLSGGYLAVDLFFIISGVVVAHAYSDKLRGGWGFGRFVLVRALRLMPLYWLALLFAAAVAGAGVLLGQGHWSVGGLILTAACGAVMIPSVAAHRNELYPLNIPTWSLAWEWVANIAYALLCRRADRRQLVVLLVPAEAAVALAAWRHGTLDIGHDWATPLLGFVRVTASFTMGLLIFDLMRAGKLPRLRVPPVLLLVATGLVLALPSSLGWTKDVLAVWLVLPFLCVAAVQNEPRSPKLHILLGATSYPIYVLHAALPVPRLMEWLGAITGRAPAPWGGLLGIVGVAGLGLALARWIDLPVRRSLTHRFRRKEAPQPVGDEAAASELLKPRP
jgi:peptidoglycan/LPS O-acetylase OafA/YrhL